MGHETLWGKKNVSFAGGCFDTLIDENALQCVYIILFNVDMTYSQEFDADFADSPIKRSGLDRLKRNAQICLNNITS